MSLKSLLNNQKIRIDDHKWGNREEKNWDNPNVDIHIDKSTKHKIEGKQQTVKIRIPINSERPINVEVKGRKFKEVPYKLRKEIVSAFENKVMRDLFIKDLESELKNYNSMLSNEDKIHQSLNRIAKHFGLKWTEKKISTYVSGKLEVYTEIHTDDGQKLYFLTADRMKITIGDIDQWTRHEIRLARIK